MPDGSLEVLLISAQNIYNTDLFGKQDPYALVSYGHQNAKSAIATDQGTSPIWNQKFTFLCFGEEISNELLVQIYDADRFSKDDLIGTVKITLDEAFAGRAATATAYPVVKTNGKIKGDLKLSITFQAKTVL